MNDSLKACSIMRIIHVKPDCNEDELVMIDKLKKCVEGCKIVTGLCAAAKVKEEGVL